MRRSNPVDDTERSVTGPVTEVFHLNRTWAQGSIWLVLYLIALDQVTKALAPRPQVELDPGSGTWLPSVIGQAFKVP